MPAAKSAPAHAAEKPAKSNIVSDLIHKAESAVEGLVGHSLVVHKLDVAFVHALAGAKSDAEDALDAAEAEVGRFEALAEKDYALLVARVHAVLGK